MALNSIVDKIAKLNEVIEVKHGWSEPEVLYFMVQLRKVLDYRTGDIPVATSKTVRFFADWSVHIKKDRRTIEILDVLSEVEYAIRKEVANPHLQGRWTATIDFVYFKGLLNGINEMLAVYGLGTLPHDLSFVTLLAKVLEEQPLIPGDLKPEDTTICKIELLPAADEVVIMRVEFSEPLIGQGREEMMYTLMNHY
jgi:hypothetical protein